MRTAALVVLLAIAASVSADITTCNVGTYLVADYSVYNLAPFQKNSAATGVFKANDVVDPHEERELYFSICHPLVDACTGDKKIFAKREEDGACSDEVATDVAVAALPMNPSDPTKGVQLVYPNATYASKTYQLKVNISCDSGASSSASVDNFKYDYEVDSNGVMVITAYQSSYYGCSIANLGELVKFMQKYKVIFTIVFIVVGLGLTFFGLKLFKVAIFTVAAVGGFFLSAVLFYQFASYGSAQWVMWVLFFVCLVIGLVLGYITVKFEKVGFFGMGLVLGVMGWFLLYGSILNSFLSLSKTISYVVAGGCGIIGGALAMWLYKDILIISTAFIGSFLSVASIFSYIPSAPSISDALNSSNQWSALLIAQLVAIGVLTVVGMFVQFKHKKTEEDEEQENNDEAYNHIAKNY